MNCEKEGTPIALAEKNGELFVIHNEGFMRTPLAGALSFSDDPFVELVNASNLRELLLAYEALRMREEELFFIEYRSEEDMKPVPLSAAREICSLFEDSNPSRGTLEKTREAINAWSAESLVDLSGESAWGGPTKALPMFNFKTIYECTPLRTIVKAMDDLRRHSMLLAWLVGKTDFATAHGLQAGKESARFERLGEGDPKDLSDYYKELGESPCNDDNRFTIRTDVSRMHLLDPAEAEEPVKKYVRAAFDLVLSDETRKLNDDMVPQLSCNTLLCAAWSHMATGISQGSGPGAIGVCKHCGKFFESQRATKQYCSESCRVMATRNRTLEAIPGEIF